MKITILGAAGFVGGHLQAALLKRGDHVTPASLRDPAAAAGAVANADAVVNLAGEPVAQRWTAEVKAKIMSSRSTAVDALREELARREIRVPVYVSASAIGYYGTSDDVTFDEESAPGSDFLASVCVAWEASASRFGELGARVAMVRTGLALGRDGGALAKLLPIFGAGGGGPVGSGKQWYSWIAIEDLVGIYLAAIDGLEGPLNATAPNPVRNSEFTRALAHAVHRPAIIPVPAIALKLMLGEGALVVADGQRVVPTRTQRLGYRFVYEEIGPALAGILA